MMSRDASLPAPVDLSRRTATSALPPLEIAGPSASSRLLGPLVRWMAIMALFAVAVVAFRQLSASWRVAMVVVGCMAAYMTAVGRMVEGRADRID